MKSVSLIDWEGIAAAAAAAGVSCHFSHLYLLSPGLIEREQEIHQLTAGIYCL
jgi:hypothetical protein